MTGSLAVLVPGSAAEAAELFGDGSDVTVVGGGTVVVPAHVRGQVTSSRALYLGRAGLAGITRDGTRTTIGATTTVAALVDLPAPLGAAAANVGDAEVRGQATLGGNLCVSPMEVPRGDLQGALVALDATVRSTGAGGERSEPIADFLPRRGERLVLDVSFEEPAAGAYVHLDRAHTHEYTALAVSAVRSADGSVRLAVAGADDHAVAIPVDGADPDLSGIDFRDDALASAWYKQRVLPVLVRRALEKLGASR